VGVRWRFGLVRARWRPVCPCRWRRPAPGPREAAGVRVRVRVKGNIPGGVKQ
jgi:hypothetical protein